jgi:membrane protein DedA with SNARE-associated domain
MKKWLNLLIAFGWLFSFYFNWEDGRPDAVLVLNLVALFIFLGISAYYWIQEKRDDQKLENHNKK